MNKDLRTRLASLSQLHEICVHATVTSRFAGMIPMQFDANVCSLLMHLITTPDWCVPYDTTSRDDCFVNGHDPIPCSASSHVVSRAFSLGQCTSLSPSIAQHNALCLFVKYNMVESRGSVLRFDGG